MATTEKQPLARFRPLTSFEITVTGNHLSDVWFNFQKPHFDRYCDSDEDANFKEMAEALRKDAKQFINCIIGPMEFVVEEEELIFALVTDFRNRL